MKNQDEFKYRSGPQWSLCGMFPGTGWSSAEEDLGQASEKEYERRSFFFIMDSENVKNFTERVKMLRILSQSFKTVHRSLNASDG